MIKFYSSKDPYGWMNNYKKSPMFIFGRWWKNVESAYQAQKTLNPIEYDKIWSASHPDTARLLGQELDIRSDWDQIKIYTMYQCVLAKFVQNRELRELLFATGDEELAEDSPIDYFWGLGTDGSGQNNLGKVLMSVRLELRTSNYNDLFNGIIK